MKKVLQFAGIAGLMTLILGLVVSLVQQKLTLIAIVHLIAGGSLFLAGVVANIAEIREYLSRRTVRMGPQVFIQVGLLLLVLLLVNLIVSRHDRHLDTTDRGLYTLSPATLKVGHSLAGKVRVIASLPGGGSPETRQRLQLFASTFPNIDLITIDPDKNEDIARSENLPTQAGVMFKYKDRNIWISKFDEAEITNALIKATRDFSPRVWFTTGHLEPSLKDESPSGLSQLSEALTLQGFRLESVDLSTKTDVSPDVSLIAIVGPALPFSASEVKLLDFYLSQGGSAVVFIDPLLDPRAATGLEPFLRAYGVEARDNLIFDPQSHLSRDQSGLWIIPESFSGHQITSELSQPRAVIYMSRSLDFSGRVPPGTEVIPLLTTSSGAFAKTVDLPSIPTMTKEQSTAYFAQLLGPAKEGTPRRYKLAMAVTASHNPPAWKQASQLDRSWESRMVVFGAGSITRNMSFDMPFNSEVLTNAFNWTAGTVDLSATASKTRGGDRLHLDESQMNKILYLSVLIMPELFMMIGLAVWWRKR